MKKRTHLELLLLAADASEHRPLPETGSLRGMSLRAHHVRKGSRPQALALELIYAACEVYLGIRKDLTLKQSQCWHKFAEKNMWGSENGAAALER